MLCPTKNHPLFSASRQGRVPAGLLVAGEQLVTRGGVVTVESITLRAGAHRVYNLEVDADHCYYAGAAAVLSHNNCAQISKAAERGGARTLTAAEQKLYGPVTRPAGFKEKVWELNKGADGLVRDPSGKVLRFDEPWELGHVPGYKAADMRVWAAEQGMDRATWIKVQNDPYIYRPELPRTNSGHLWEFTW